MQRQVSLNRLETDIETVGWMNHFLDRFWLIFEPVLSAQVIGQVDAILSENTPSFLDSIRMSSFTLGTKAPRIDGIKVYPGTAPDVVVKTPLKKKKSIVIILIYSMFCFWLVYGLEVFFYS
jgi:Ca2+-dependent lipid-binding protein